jgi:hypothetical protein
MAGCIRSPVKRGLPDKPRTARVQVQPKATGVCRKGQEQRMLTPESQIHASKQLHVGQAPL